MLKQKDTRNGPALDAEATQLASPEVWREHYSEDEREHITRLIGWLNEHGKTQAWLARLSRVNAGTLNQILKGSYPSAAGKFLGQMREAIKLYEERRGKRSVPFVETSVVKLARAACHRARLYHNFAVLAGYVGTGKTEALKQIAQAMPNTYLVEADPDMGPGWLLESLVEATRAEVNARGKFSRGTTAEKFRGLIKALDRTGSLIIIDEAETIQPRSLHYLRRLRDKAGVGVVLSGTEHLSGLLKPEHGQFDQIRSRVGYWPTTITSISREDSDQVATAAFDELELQPPVLDALWRYCDGSIRVLAEDLVTAIRDYGLSRGRSLDAKLVQQIATQVLGLKARKEVA